MISHRCCMLVALFGLAMPVPTVYAQDAAPAEPPTDSATQAAPEPSSPVSEPSSPTPKPKHAIERPATRSALIYTLDQTLKGQRVVAVGYESGIQDGIDCSPEAVAKAHTLLEKLQLISSRYSSDKNAIIPYRINGAWAIAPETRQELSSEWKDLSPLDLSSRGTQIDVVLSQLTPAQIKQLGSERGLAVSNLPPELVARLQRAFRPPLRIIGNKPSTWTDSNGLKHTSIAEEERGKLSEPLDLRRARIRARLQTNGAMVQSQGQGYMSVIGANRDTGLSFIEEEGRRYGNWDDRMVDIPLFQEVPNTYKPSDLQGRRFPRPIGISGALMIADVVKRLETVTGLKLRVSRYYGDQPVFIGSPSLSAGEVMDALRLGLAASWRKVGNLYLLAWDRMGLRAVQMMAEEAGYGTKKGARKEQREREKNPVWLTYADSLPFGADDPLALTSEQRRKIFGDGGTSPGAEVGFDELTPEQQDYLRKEAKNEVVYIPSPDPDTPATPRQLRDDEVQSAHLTSYATIDVSIQVPGYGWVRADRSWDHTTLNNGMLATIRRKQGGADQPAAPREDIPPEIREMIEHPKPVPVPAPVGALMVPVLSPARLNTLAEEMKRHGLNTLFYPVLYGGYATFPTQQFPLHPALRGSNGWAAAVAAMKPAGIEVVGYLNTLSWQESGNRAHWLNKHPDWVDVDAAGQTRLQWYDAHPDAPTNPFLPGTPANYVRTSEPMVCYKLEGILADFAKQSGSAGIGFADWWPSSLPPLGPFAILTPPGLGCSLPDRVQAIEADGWDPVDRVNSDSHLPKLPQNIHPDIFNNETDPRYATLVGDLMKKAKSLHSDWKTYLFNDNSVFTSRIVSGEDNKAAVHADVEVNSMFLMGGRGSNGAVMFPITGKNIFGMAEDLGEAPDGIGDLREKLLKMPSIAFFSLMLSEPRIQTRQFSAVIYDFRQSPEAITESVRWVKAREEAPKSAANRR